MKPIRIVAGLLAGTVLAGGFQAAHAQFRIHEGRTLEQRDTESRYPAKARGPLEVTVQSEAERQPPELELRPVSERRTLPESRPIRASAETPAKVEQWPSENLVQTAQADQGLERGTQARGDDAWIAGLHGYTIGVAKAAPSAATLSQEMGRARRGAEGAGQGWRERSVSGVAGYTVMEQPTRKYRPY